MKYFVACIMVVSVTACDSFFDINVSPNLAATVPPRTLMAGITGSLGFHMGSDIHRYSSIFAQQFTGGGGVGIQTVEFSRYNITATDVNNVWRGAFYGNVLSDCEQLKQQTQGVSPHYSGIAKIVQAYLFAMAVDAWGTVPFSEALQFAGNTKPKYDDGEDVYAALFPLIDEGIADLLQTTSLLSPTADDLIYGGTRTNWIRFANSLKIRMYVKYYPTNSTFANNGIAAVLTTAYPQATPAIVSPPLFTGNAQNFVLAFETSADRQNSIDQFERRRQNQFWPTTTIVNLMNSRTDPRRDTYFLGNAGVFTGLDPGSTVVSPTTSRMHTYLRGAVTNAANPVTGYAGDRVQRMLTFAETQFNLAEYYLRTNQAANAQTAFTAGITASFADAGASATAYLATYGTLSGDFNTALEQIIVEKYIANYGVPMEPWSDWRRTGFPVLTPVSGGALAAIPRILPFSDLERVTNPENTPKREAADLITSQVFWDPAN